MNLASIKRRAANAWDVAIMAGVIAAVGLAALICLGGVLVGIGLALRLVLKVAGVVQ